MEAHHSRGECISIAEDQRSPDPRDWDVDSEAVSEIEHDETNMGGENIIINSEPPNPWELNVESGASSNAGQLRCAWHAVYMVS